MTVVGRLDAFQRRHPAAGFPLAVLYKYIDDQGGNLAALIAYYGFVSLFPLLLLLTTILGFVLAGHPHLQQQVLDSALGQFPVVGQQLGEPKRIGGGALGLTIGILGSLYGGLGVGQAVQNAMNTVWAVPRNSRPDPLAARGRSLLLLLTAGIAVLGTTVLSTLGASGAGSFGPLLKVVVLVGSVAVNAVVFLTAFRIATALDLSLRAVAPGALAAAIVWQLLQSFGVVYVAHVVKGSSATNGVFAVVLGLLAFLYLTATAVVLCAEINVVRARTLHPRALLTPFTDNVELTHGDRRSYTGMATAQRAKGFEDVAVRFDPPASASGDPAGHPPGDPAGDPAGHSGERSTDDPAGGSAGRDAQS
jgi:YihY family inner membrane protein